jgi:uncharacterized repeat protein (TIGR01451 family)
MTGKLVRIVTRADVVLSKASMPTLVVDDPLVLYTLTVTNAGPEEAIAVEVVDQLPAGVVFDPGASHPKCIFSNGVVRCSLKDLSAGAVTAATVAVWVEGSVVGGVTNEAEVHIVSIDTNIVGNSDVAATSVQDLDGDGAPDFADLDDDNDGMPDAWEIEGLLDPKNPADAMTDADTDTLLNIEEYIADTNPQDIDSFFFVEDLTSDTAPTVSFESAEDRVYTLQYRDQEQVLWSNVTGRVRVPGDPSGVGELDDPQGRSGRSYRLLVEFADTP